MKLNIPGVQKADNTFLVPLTEIEVNPADNVSRFFTKPNRDAVRQDIIKNGQRDPVVLRRAKLASGKKFKLEAGYGRLEILSDFNKTVPEDQQRKVLATVIDGNEEDGLVENLRENLLRNESSYMDQAYAIRVMGDRLKWTDTKIAEFFGGPSKMGWVQQRKKLLSLPTEIQEALGREEYTLTGALKLAEFDETAQKVINATMAAAAPATAPLQTQSGSVTLDEVTEATTARSAAPASTAAAPATNPTPKPKGKPAGPQQVLQAAATAGITPPKAQKRTYAEIKDFFEVMIGSPAIHPRMQRLAVFMVNELINGNTPDDGDAVKLLAEAIDESEDE